MNKRVPAATCMYRNSTRALSDRNPMFMVTDIQVYCLNRNWMLFSICVDNVFFVILSFVCVLQGTSFDWRLLFLVSRFWLINIVVVVL